MNRASDQHKHMKNTKQNKTKKVRKVVTTIAKTKRVGPRYVGPLKTKGGKLGVRNKISDCALAYGAALVDPFGVVSPICVPDNIVLPSFKFATRIRGTLTCNSSGYAFAAVDPYQMVYNNGANFGSAASASYQQALVQSTATYSGTGYNIGATTNYTSGIVGTNSNSMFTILSLTSPASIGTNGTNMRLVAAGLALKFTGTDLANGGTVTLYRQQANGPIPGTVSGDGTVYTSAQMLASPYAEQLPLSREMRYVYFTPATPTDLAYSPVSSFIPVIGVTNDNRCMIITVDGAAVGASFMIDVIAHFELVGVNMPLTPSHADAQGMSLVQTAIPSSAPTGEPKTTYREYLGYLQGAVNEVYNVASRMGNMDANASWYDMAKKLAFTYAQLPY
jgi:hypothetical protein